MDDMTRWNFTVRLSRAVQRKLKVYAVENGIELQDIGEQALRLWAEKNQVALPPLHASEPEQEPRAVVVR
jgi:hypothetical protein